MRMEEDVRERTGRPSHSWLKQMAEATDYIMSKLPKGPHIVAASAHPSDTRGEPAILDEVLAWCGGPGACVACDDGRGVTVQEMLAWKDYTGWMAAIAFGKHGHACCSLETYEELRSSYATRTVHQAYISIYYDPLLGRGLNSFSVHVAEGVTDGFLVKCNDCTKESKDGK
jgi:hypothetical protein